MQDPAPPLGGRIANVAGAVIVEDGSVDAAGAVAAALERVFDEVLIVEGGRDGTPLAQLAEAFARATADRVLVVGSGRGTPAVALLLALVAWPEHDAVAPCIGRAPEPLFAIYRRRKGLDAARDALDDGRTSIAQLLDSLDVGRLEGDDLEAVAPRRT